MLLSLKPLSNIDLLRDLYADPYISRVGHDHRRAAPIAHPDARYLGAYVNDDLVGAFLIVESGFIEWDLHALLRKQALQHSRALGSLCLHEVFSHPFIQRVTAYVIEGLATARNYCLKLGFKNEGFRRDACMQGGRLLGVHILGMTRNDWKFSK